MPEAGADLWRGCTNAWECDEMGHQNVRFYVLRAVEGLAELLARMGLPVRPIAGTDPSARITHHHIRMIRELHPGTPIHLRGGFVEFSEQRATVAQILYVSETGAPSAGFLTEIEYRDRNGRPGPWPEAFRRAAALIPPPELCAPRGLAEESPFPVDSGLTDRLNMVMTGCGIFGEAACDQNRRLRPEQFVATISDATRILVDVFQRAAATLPDAPARIGSAGVEVRIDYFRYPVAGDRYVIWGGIAELNERSRRPLYWMLDRATGEPVGRLETVELLLDLDARRSIRLTPEALQSLMHHVIVPARAALEEEPNEP